MCNKLIFAVAASLLFASCAPAAGNISMQTGLDKLAIFGGRWEVKTVYFKTPYTEPHTEDVLLTTSCSRVGNHYYCDQFDKTGSKRLIDYRYDSKMRDYSAYFITDKTGHLGSGMTLTTKGSVWTYSAELKNRRGEKLYERIINNFTGPATMDFSDEYSTDNIHWIMMSKGHETRT